MMCRHTVLSMEMEEVRWVVYCVTVVVGGGIDVMMACRNAWRLSDSLCSPHALCSSCLVVTSDNFSLWFDQSFGRVWMSVLMWSSLVFRDLER